MIAQAGAADRALGAEDRPQTGRVRHPQGSLSGSMGHGPMALDPIQSDDGNALAVQCPT